MKELITKLKEIETIVELNVGKELTEETATDIYGLANELMCKVKKLPIYDVSSLLKAEREATKEEIREWLIAEDFEGLAERL